MLNIHRNFFYSPVYNSFYSFVSEHFFVYFILSLGRVRNIRFLALSALFAFQKFQKFVIEEEERLGAGKSSRSCESDFKLRRYYKVRE